jgi:Concanavalin A-like lectin/glucanases superfamily
VKTNDATQSNQTVLTKEKSPYISYQLYATGNLNARANAWRDTDGNYGDDDGVYAPALNPTPTATWTHLAVTYDSTTLRLYMNGALISSSPSAGAITNAANGALRIGGNSLWGEYFNGTIDDVRVYNRALSAGELTTDMNVGVGP